MPREKFQAVAQEVQKKTKALKISKKVVEEAIVWARKKVIIDTNVLISALGWGGKAYEIVDLGVAMTF